jgi:type IV secretion system protein VirB8
MKKETKPSKQQLDKKYFDEATEWDNDRMARISKSEKRAWIVAGTASLIALMSVGAVTAIAPLKTVEPFVIRVDNNNGHVDVVSTLAKSAGNIKEESQEVLDKYWLSQYIQHREGYLWDIRSFNREAVGLLSDTNIQQQYANYTNPKTNPNAPVLVYGDSVEVTTSIKSISFLSKNVKVNDDYRDTALVRYTKTVKKQGVKDYTTHWAATVTYTYRNTPMNVQDRLINPLGFQVTAYRNDAETGAIE